MIFAHKRTKWDLACVLHILSQLMTISKSLFFCTFVKWNYFHTKKKHDWWNWTMENGNFNFYREFKCVQRELSLSEFRYTTEREKKVQKIPLTWYVQCSYQINEHTFAVHFLNAQITFPIRMCCYLTATNSKWFCISYIVLCGIICASANLSEEKKIAIIILNNSRKNSVRQSTW